MDDPRQPRDQLLAEDRLRPLRGHRRAGGQLGEARRAVHPRRQARRETCSSRRASPRYKKLRDVPPTTLTRCVCAHPLKGVGGGYDFAVPLLAGDHVTDDTGTGFVHTAPATAARTSTSGWRNARELEARGINTDDPLHRRRGRRLHRARAGLRRQARAQRQGREGRRQRGRDQGAGRGRHAARARPAQASVSAFLALEEAGDLPQHAAMVHRDGQADRGRRRRRKPATRCAHRALDAIEATRWVPAAGREPHHRHDRRAGPTG